MGGRGGRGGREGGGGGDFDSSKEANWFDHILVTISFFSIKLQASENGNFRD